ncbi:shikimate dehydrogenase [Limoniibacter endophyticus]|uniref:Shikimate dehydrogenase (NADP(+)) n=1 Tax=Limoniibacter endophyticus TaxID=1565040 RepID=A0A8J3DIE0_9HYPH|nr:shikimate dehydrogenase [Limoniibacter endophyticus]GHC74406.1 shikimate dehydrogenase (NADP(+)) [Limoniibacter endophyticus]
MADMKKAFVCGHPISHSRSPKIHGYWLNLFGIEGSYEAVDKSPTEFAAFLASLESSGFAGGNLTIPYKQAVIPLLDEVDAAAKAIGAVNTIWFEKGRLLGSNTDAYGFAANLDTRVPGWDAGKVAVVLGAGGAARAILYALRCRGFDTIFVLNRSLERAQELANLFGCRALQMSQFEEIADQADLLVNTTSLGMRGQPDLNLDITRLPERCIVSDIVYVPLKTSLLAAAEERGLKTVDGLGMLLHQAIPGFERWFGPRPAVTPELYKLIISDIVSGT